MVTQFESMVSRPTRPGTAQEFVVELRRLRAQVGQPSFRELSRVAERRASAVGARSEALPPSTTSEVLSGKRLPRLPRWEFVEAYVGACLGTVGVDRPLIDAEVAHWHALWRSLASVDDCAPTVTDDPHPMSGEPPVAVVAQTVGEPGGSGRRGSARWRRSLMSAVLVTTFLAGVGLGVVGSRWWPDRVEAAMSDPADYTPVDSSRDDSCAPAGAAAPPGRDVLWSSAPRSGAAGAGDGAATWWASNVDGVGLVAAGRGFQATVHGGTLVPGDLVIVKSDVPLRLGRQYALAFTATADRPTTVRVRVQEGEPPHYYPSYSKDLPVGTAACRHVHHFAARRTSARSELTFQVGGHADKFRLLVSDVLLVEQQG